MEKLIVNTITSNTDAKSAKAPDDTVHDDGIAVDNDGIAVDDTTMVDTTSSPAPTAYTNTSRWGRRLRLPGSARSHFYTFLLKIP